jgi:hypothetical protein
VATRAREDRNVRLALILPALLAVAFTAPASARPRPLTCHSPAVFHHGRARILTRVGPANDRAWYLCSTRFRRPQLFLDEGANVKDSQFHFRRFGHRIGYSWAWDDSLTRGWEVGWVDVRNAIGAASTVSFNNVQDSLGIRGIAVAPNGTMAYLEGVQANPSMPQPSERIGFVPRLGRGLGDPRTLLNVPAADVLPNSLAIGPSAISWTTQGGAPGSVQVPGATP